MAQREEALAKQLAEQRRKKAKLVDPLQYEMSIQAEDLSGYVPAFGWEAGPPTEQQTAALEKLGILPDAVESAGKASLLLDRLHKRRMKASPHLNRSAVWRNTASSMWVHGVLSRPNT